MLRNADRHAAERGAVAVWHRKEAVSIADRALHRDAVILDRQRTRAHFDTRRPADRGVAADRKVADLRMEHGGSGLFAGNKGTLHTGARNRAVCNRDDGAVTQSVAENAVAGAGNAAVRKNQSVVRGRIRFLRSSAVAAVAADNENAVSGLDRNAVDGDGGALPCADLDGGRGGLDGDLFDRNIVVTADTERQRRRYNRAARLPSAREPETVESVIFTPLLSILIAERTSYLLSIVCPFRSRVTA